MLLELLLSSLLLLLLLLLQLLLLVLMIKLVVLLELLILYSIHWNNGGWHIDDLILIFGITHLWISSCAFKGLISNVNEANQALLFFRSKSRSHEICHALPFTDALLIIPPDNLYPNQCASHQGDVQRFSSFMKLDDFDMYFQLFFSSCRIDNRNNTPSRVENCRVLHESYRIAVVRGLQFQ